MTDQPQECTRRCGRPARPGGSYCAECRAENNRASAASKRRSRPAMRAQGFCADGCGRRTHGEVRCPPCAGRVAGRRRARRLERLAAGLCGECGANPRRPGRANCLRCAADLADYRRALRGDRPPPPPTTAELAELQLGLPGVDALSPGELLARLPPSVTDRALRMALCRLVAAGRLVRPARGLYALAGVNTCLPHPPVPP